MKQLPSNLPSESMLNANASVYQALIDDYDLLLFHLRAAEKALEDPVKTPLKPLPSAALELAVRCAIAPWNPEDASENRATINAVEEKRARHALQLNSGVGIDSLDCGPTDEERTAILAKRRDRKTPRLKVSQLLAETTQRKIQETVEQFLPAAGTSPLGYLIAKSNLSLTVEQVRTTPTVFLEKLLSSPEAARLASELLTKLNWYGANPGEDSSPGVRFKLLSRAIRVWAGRSRMDDPRDIAGYPWHQRSNYGKSYLAIWAEFEKHLQDTGQASSPIEAILLARLFEPAFPGDFQITGIPSQLLYRSSAVWVNFAHGLALAEILAPENIQRMTFQQFIDFPLSASLNASEQEKQLIALCRIPPALDWAITNGFVRERADSVYSEEEQTRALTQLDVHTEALKNAIVALDADVPQRAAIAGQEVEKVFGSQVFSTDGRKLTRYPHADGSDRRVPSLRDKFYSFRDVYLAGQLRNRNWVITTTDGVSKTPGLIRIDSQGQIITTAKWIPEAIRIRSLPDIEALFSTQYNAYLTSSKSAYQTVLESLFSSLPHDDRQAIEHGAIRVYTLRHSSGKDREEDTPASTLPLRLRMGFILQLACNGSTTCYECLPRVGLIRRRNDFSTEMLGGSLIPEVIKQFPVASKISVRKGKPVPFDWAAHETGSLPKPSATCEAIIDQLGETFEPIAPFGYPIQISSSRAGELARFIARDFFYFDEGKLLLAAKGETELERIAARPHWIESVANYLPFYGSFQDLQSDSPSQKAWGIFGLIVDIASFAFPIGKFVSGTIRLASTTARAGFRVALPPFAKSSRHLLVSSLRSLNPLDGVPSLLKISGRGVYTVNKLALRSARRNFNKLLGQSGQYDFVKGIPQASRPGTYKPLTASDELATRNGVMDIPVRKVTQGHPADVRMLDPVFNKPFGPPLADGTHNLLLGRSSYQPLHATDSDLIFELAESANVRELLEIDGRTTLFINNVPYRLDGDSLRRIELIDESTRLKRSPCRERRAPGKRTCIDEYVTGAPHPETPALRSFEESKGYAPWFGERQCTPLAREGHAGSYFLRDGVLYKVENNVAKSCTDLARLGFPKAWPEPKKEILADLQFRRGIFGRIEIQGAYEGSNELHRVGAILVPSSDETSTYLFTRLNSDKYYMTTIPANKNLSELQTLTMGRVLKPALVEGTVGAELVRVYEGSMSANNTVAVHGRSAVERAMRTMERIAIPIGTPAHPEVSMKWLKVDTSPGEALMFDHSTRMIVTQLPAGETTWSRRNEATETVRIRTAEIFETLFKARTTTQSSGSQFRINNAMKQLHVTQPLRLRSSTPRNIAYAEVVTNDGGREVYVSVSGAQKTTGQLPLFKTHRDTDRVSVDGTDYFNADLNETPPKTSLLLDSQDNLLAIPKTYPKLPDQPTSLDSESKLIRLIHQKYPDKRVIQSVNVATTMAPCESCAIVLKAFGHDGGESALSVVWK